MSYGESTTLVIDISSYSCMIGLCGSEEGPPTISEPLVVRRGRGEQWLLYDLFVSLPVHYEHDGLL